MNRSIDDFYEVNGCEHYPVSWFISEENKLEYYFNDSRVSFDGTFDGETLYSEGYLSEIILEDDYYLISFVSQPNEFYKIRASERVIGEIKFHHWRRGFYSEFGY